MRAVMRVCRNRCRPARSGGLSAPAARQSPTGVLARPWVCIVFQVLVSMGGSWFLYNMANIRVGSYRKNYEKKVAERFSFQKIRSTRLQSALISFVQFNFLNQMVRHGLVRDQRGKVFNTLPSPNGLEPLSFANVVDGGG